MLLRSGQTTPHVLNFAIFKAGGGRGVSRRGFVCRTRASLTCFYNWMTRSCQSEHSAIMASVALKLNCLQEYIAFVSFRDLVFYSD